MARETQTDRRRFLQAGALGAAAVAATHAGSAPAPAQDAARPPIVPRRKLGKTGAEITMLDQGVVRGPTLDRVLRQSYAAGVRTFDTAKVYGSEPNFKKWFHEAPELRKEIFLITKDTPRTPEEFPGMLDERLETLGTDYVDLFFVHGLGDAHSLDEALAFVRSKAFAEAADKIRKSGKARFIGFSTHHKDRAQMIEAAAESGVVDAIMLQYTPWLDKDSPLNKALDAAYSRGIGLISMKQIAGHTFGDPPKGDILEDVKKRVPALAERNLSPFQGLLHAIWTDERITSVCTSMRNTDQIRENTDAARRFQPLEEAAIDQLRDEVLAHGPLMCADCDGRCSTAGNTQAQLGVLTRYLTYYKHHGLRADARRQFAELSAEARDWSTADLEAARQACPMRLNFAQLLPEADRRLS